MGHFIPIVIKEPVVALTSLETKSRHGPIVELPIIRLHDGRR
jgi:hypothetical protein